MCGTRSALAGTAAASAVRAILASRHAPQCYGRTPTVSRRSRWARRRAGVPVRRRSPCGASFNERACTQSVTCVTQRLTVTVTAKRYQTALNAA